MLKLKVLQYTFISAEVEMWMMDKQMDIRTSSLRCLSGSSSFIIRSFSARRFSSRRFWAASVLCEWAAFCSVSTVFWRLRSAFSLVCSETHSDRADIQTHSETHSDRADIQTHSETNICHLHPVPVAEICSKIRRSGSVRSSHVSGASKY